LMAGRNFLSRVCDARRKDQRTEHRGCGEDHTAGWHIKGRPAVAPGQPDPVDLTPW
jgi:hypothetical protein